MSRFELLVAIGLLAVIGGSVFLVARPSFAEDNRSMKRLAEPLTLALSAWKKSHANECPTLGLLEAEGFLEFGSRREDPWGASFRVACDDGELSLVSPGPDARLSTNDDVHIPVR